MERRPRSSAGLSGRTQPRSSERKREKAAAPVPCSGSSHDKRGPQPPVGAVSE
jgi:hypothetical protein